MEQSMADQVDNPFLHVKIVIYFLYQYSDMLLKPAE